MKTLLGSDRAGQYAHGGLLFYFLSCMLLNIPHSTKKKKKRQYKKYKIKFIFSNTLLKC